MAGLDYGKSYRGSGKRGDNIPKDQEGVFYSEQVEKWLVRILKPVKKNSKRTVMTTFSQHELEQEAKEKFNSLKS